MKKNSWPAKFMAMPQGCPEGYLADEDLSDLYEENSGLWQIFRNSGYNAAQKNDIPALCMGSFGTLGVCLQCIQTLISQNHGYHASVTFELCSVSMKPRPDGFKSTTEGIFNAEAIQLELKMCMLNSETTKLIFILHCTDGAGKGGTHTVGYYELSGDSTATELAKMTYLSPCMSVPAALTVDAESEGGLGGVGYIDAGSWIPEMMQRRKTAQGSIQFIGPATLTWAISRLDKPDGAGAGAASFYYVRAVKDSRYQILNYSKKPDLIDGMVALHPGNTSLGENDAQAIPSDAPTLSKKYGAQLIAFDHTIAQLIKTEKEEKEKENQSVEFGIPVSRIIRHQDEIFIKTSDTRPGGDNGYSRSLSHSLVFYEEIKKCNIPGCEHQPLQNIS